jgi:hypothetical protein
MSVVVTCKRVCVRGQGESTSKAIQTCIGSREGEPIDVQTKL